MEKTNKNGFLNVPTAIILAGIIIAAAVIYAFPKNSPNNDIVADKGKELTASAVDSIQPVSNKDHIRGNPNAAVKIIEFSDLECPFCKRFHLTMQQAMDEYGKEVAWVYRHFPLDALHSKARKEAEATECANELGGNDKFWDYVDKLFEITPSNNQLDLALLPKIAAEIGLDKVKFENCLASQKYSGHIESDVKDAVASGARGTPYSVVISKNGEKFIINGAQPYSSVKQIIDTALGRQ